MGTSNVVTPNKILNEFLILLNVVRIVGKKDSHPRDRTLPFADGHLKVACLPITH